MHILADIVGKTSQPHLSVRWIHARGEGVPSQLRKALSIAMETIAPQLSDISIESLRRKAQVRHKQHQMVVGPQSGHMSASAVLIDSLSAILSGVHILYLVLHVIACILQGRPQILHKLREMLSVETAIVTKVLLGAILVLGSKRRLVEVMLQPRQIVVIVGKGVKQHISLILKGLDTLPINAHIPLILMPQLHLGIVIGVEVETSLLHSRCIQIRRIVPNLHIHLFYYFIYQTFNSLLIYLTYTHEPQSGCLWSQS